MPCRWRPGLCDPAKPGPNCFLRDVTHPFYIHENGYGVGLFVQDRWWTPLRWLTINPGLRADWGTPPTTGPPHLLALRLRTPPGLHR